MKTKYIAMAFATLLLAACGSGTKKEEGTKKKEKEAAIAIDEGLRQRVAEFARKPRVKGKFGLYVYDLTADKPIYAENETEPIPSASCMKLLSGVAGLHLMGTDYAYPTTIYMRGQQRGDTLHGDIGFRASFDPQLMASDLRKYAKALRDKGIRSFKGKLYVDLALKNPVKSEAHWYPWDLSFSRYGLLYKGAPRVVRELKAALRAQGIAVRDSQVVMAAVPRGSKMVYRHYQSIRAVTLRMWKNSSNTQATSMLYTIGHKVNPGGSPTAEGVRYLRWFLKHDIGETDKRLVIHDGCGLCTQNRLSARSLVAVLRYAYHDKQIFPILYDQLSIAGVDGTLARQMSHQKVRGKIHAKTGTLSHPYGISSLAGYCTARDGHLIAFAIMDSEMSVLDAHVLQRKLCQVLVE